jgi:hypothetical protein
MFQQGHAKNAAAAKVQSLRNIGFQISLYITGCAFLNKETIRERNVGPSPSSL